MKIDKLLEKEGIFIELADFNKFIRDCNNNEIKDIGIMTENIRLSLFWYQYLNTLSSKLNIVYEKYLLEYDIVKAKNENESKIYDSNIIVQELKKIYQNIKRKVTQAKRLSTDLSFQRDLLFNRFID